MSYDAMAEYWGISAIYIYWDGDDYLITTCPACELFVYPEDDITLVPVEDGVIAYHKECLERDHEHHS